MPSVSRQFHLPLFFTLAVILLVTEWFVTQSPAFLLRPDALSLGVTVDVVLGLPLLYYWFIVRTSRWSKTSLVAVFALSVGLAKWLLPADNQTYVNGVAPILPLLELAVLGYVAYQGVAVQRAYREHRRANPDFVQNLQQSLAEVTGKVRLSQLIATEAAVFRYGLLGWIPDGKVDDKRQVFTSHRTSAQVAMLITTMGICCVETVAFHFLIARWSPIVAWFLTAVSLYSLLFLIAETVVTVSQPTYLADQTLHLRFGLRWRATIALADVICIDHIAETPEKSPDLLNGPLLVQPNVLLTAARTDHHRGNVRPEKSRNAGGFAG